MKYPILALFALSMFSLAACQNNSSSSGNPASTDIPPAADSDALYGQIMTELVEGKGQSRKYDSIFVQFKALTTEIGTVYGDLEAGSQAEIKKLRYSMKDYIEPYAIIEDCAVQLDSLSARLRSGRTKKEEAQIEFNALRKQMRGGMEGLSKTPVDFSKYRATFEEIVAKDKKKVPGGG